MMNAFKRFLKAANGVVTVVVAALVIIAVAYAVYSIWDNSTVYTEVDDVMDGIKDLKPDIAGDVQASFEELRAINKDTCAWITLDGTNIDYPVLQGKDNLTYLNKNVYGRFAMAGSIFLDSNCDNTFSSKYSLLYGHHMDEHKMFGDLDLYKENAFFEENTTGTLILPEQTYKLETFACLEVEASDEYIFQPLRWKDDASGLIDYVSTNAGLLNFRQPENISSEAYPQILAMSTCSADNADARIILLAVMIPDL